MVEVTRLLSNLIKSGFVAFSKEDAIVIDANKNKIIEGIDALTQQQSLMHEESEEEALAAALIRDVGLDDEEDMLLTLDSTESEESQALSEEMIAQHADDIIMQAKQEAEDLLNGAHDEIENMRAAAYDEIEMLKQQAIEEGYQEGYSNANAQVQAEYEEKQRLLQEQIEENQKMILMEQERLVQSTEQKMVEMLCQLIPKITGVVIQNEADVLLYMVNMAMRDLENSNNYVIRVSSDDYERLVAEKDKIYGALNPAIQLEIFEDAKLDALQCQIDTDNGIVDVSLDVQLDNLIKTLKLMVQE